MRKTMCLMTAVAFGLSAAARADDKVDFVTQIKPIFENSCVRCHNPEKHKNDLRFDNKKDALKGGKHGACIVPGKSKESDVVKRISLPEGDDDVMPGKGAHLTKEQIKLVADWIDQGAEWPDGVSLVDKSPKEKK